MSEQVRSGTANSPDPEAHSAKPQPPSRQHRVIHSEDLPRFSIGTPVATGIAIWVILLALGLIKHDQLAADGRTWWIWCAVAGVVLGLLGWLYISVRLKDLPGQEIEPDPVAPVAAAEPAPAPPLVTPIPPPSAGPPAES